MPERQRTLDHTDIVRRPIAFYPASVIFETPVHAELLEKTGVRSLITGVIDELVNLANSQGCDFKSGFREQTMERMIAPAETNSIMYQDYMARRPMEVETYLGSPIKLAQENGLQIPRVETLYALLHNLNIVNQSRPQNPPSPPTQATPRMSSAPAPNGVAYPNGRGPPPMNGHPMNGPPMRNGMRPGSRAPSAAGGPPPPMRRGPPSMSGYPPPTRMNGNGYGPPRGHPQQMPRRGSFEGNDLEEFSHLMLYDNMNEGQAFDGMATSPSGDLALRERELALRQKELALREREYHMRRGGPRMPPPPRDTYDEDDEDGEDYFDPMAAGAPPGVDPDNIDMMSVTSRRTRKAPSAGQLRSNPEMMSGAPVRHSKNPMVRPRPRQNRTSAALMADMPGLRQELMNNPLMGYSSDRFGTVDRMNMGQESRANSLTAERLSELQHGGPPGGFPHNGYPMNRRGSQSPGNPLGPVGRPPQRPSPPNGYGPPPPGHNGRPSPPGMRQPIPRHPPGHGNAVAPQQIEQQTGVSNLYPPKSGPPNQVRSLTGSASASAGSGDSNRSAPIDSEPSAHSSSSSLGPRPPVGVR